MITNNCYACLKIHFFFFWKKLQCANIINGKAFPCCNRCSLNLTNGKNFLLSSQIMLEILQAIWATYVPIFTYSYPCNVEKVLFWVEFQKLNLWWNYRFWGSLSPKIPYLEIGLCVYVWVCYLHNSKTNTVRFWM